MISDRHELCMHSFLQALNPSNLLIPFSIVHAAHGMAASIRITNTDQKIIAYK